LGVIVIRVGVNDDRLAHDRSLARVQIQTGNRAIEFYIALIVNFQIPNVTRVGSAVGLEAVRFPVWIEVTLGGFEFRRSAKPPFVDMETVDSRFEIGRGQVESDACVCLLQAGGADVVDVIWMMET
jgi:hypothetical protein